jgi:hypothetical protein
MVNEFVIIAITMGFFFNTSASMTCKISFFFDIRTVFIKVTILYNIAFVIIECNKMAIKTTLVISILLIAESFNRMSTVLSIRKLINIADFTVGRLDSHDTSELFIIKISFDTKTTNKMMLTTGYEMRTRKKPLGFDGSQLRYTEILEKFKHCIVPFGLCVQYSKRID